MHPYTHSSIHLTIHLLFIQLNYFIIITGKNKTAYRITVRQLESLIRLSEGLARLHLDEYVSQDRWEWWWLRWGWWWWWWWWWWWLRWWHHDSFNDDDGDDDDDDHDGDGDDDSDDDDGIGNGRQPSNYFFHLLIYPSIHYSIHPSIYLPIHYSRLGTSSIHQRSLSITTEEYHIRWDWRYRTRW